MRCLIITCFLVGFYAAPTPSVEPVMEKQMRGALTVEALDGYLGLISVFKDLLPKDFVKAVDNVSGDGIDCTKSFFLAQSHPEKRSCRLFVRLVSRQNKQT